MKGERAQQKRTITIGQLAAYAGVTIKTVRHYHRLGLLEEPPRDPSGYRRYSAPHAVQLVKIRTLAAAGVPLARIKDLLGADPERFAAALAQIDQDLRERADEIGRSRERLARLRAGDRLFVSAEVADFLEKLQELGVSRRGVEMERDGWILMQAVAPAQVAMWIAEKRELIEDPEFRALYLDYDAAFDLSPDDPRVDALADRAARWIGEGHRNLRAEDRSRAQGIAQLATSAGPSSPAWDRLNEIARFKAAR